MLDLVANSAAISAVTTQLLGARLVRPQGLKAEGQATANMHETGQGARGIYCTLPRVGEAATPVYSPFAVGSTDALKRGVPTGRSSPMPCEAGGRGGVPRGGHFDHKYSSYSGESVPDCLKVSVYIDDVPAGGGGFVVWPGSHRRNWAACCTDARAGLHRPVRTAPNGDAIDDHALAIMADTAPVETHGPAGTVVFWHYLLLHGAGINRRPECIRQAVIYDFKLNAVAIAELSAQLQRCRVASNRDIGSAAGDEASSLWWGWGDTAEALGADSPRVVAAISPKL